MALMALRNTSRIENPETSAVIQRCGASDQSAAAVTIQQAEIWT